jgi:hypothetical protein
MTEQTWRADNSLKGIVRGRQKRRGVGGKHDRSDMEGRQLTPRIIKGRQMRAGVRGRHDRADNSFKGMVRG